MNDQLIKLRAQELRRVLDDLSTVNDLARHLSPMLEPIIEKALNGQIHQAMTISKLPANRTYIEGMMEATPELSNAYGDFIAALGNY